MVPRLLAVLCPVLLVVAFLALLSRPTPPGEVSPEAKALDARLDGGADIVLIGNSKVGTDLDPARIGKLVGGRAVPINVNGTGAPVWYALLKNRVFANGYKPKLVIVYGTLLMMMQADLPSENQREVLAKQLGESDPVIDHKVFGEAWSDPRIQRILTSRTVLRQSITDTVRDVAAGWFIAPPGTEPLTTRGNAVVVPALGRVFGVDKITQTDRGHALPIVEREADEEKETRTRGVEETLIPDLVALAKENGAQILFVRAPLGTTKQVTDAVEVETERAVLQWLHDHDAGWLDMRTANLPDASFGDGAHMSVAGRERFTPLLLQALQKVGVGGQALTAADPTAVRRPPTPRRVGTGPTLPALDPKRGQKQCDWQAFLNGYDAISDFNLAAEGFGKVSPVRVLEDGKPLEQHGDDQKTVFTCGGASFHRKNVVRWTPTEPDPESVKRHTYTADVDPSVPLRGPENASAWWVYPGSTVALDVPEAPGPVTQAVVFAIERIPGTAPARVRVGGEWVPLVQSGDRLEARASGPPVTGPWTLEIESPPDGPWLLLDRVVTGSDDSPWYLVGRPAAEASVDLFVVGKATYAERSLELPPLSKPPVEAGWRKGLWVFPVGELGVPSLEEVFDRAGASCGALRMVVDGKQAASTTEERAAKGVDKMVHSRERGLVETAANTDPRADGHTYSFALEPSRQCLKHGQWVYPGDTMTLTAPLAALRQAGVSLRFTGATFPAEAAGVAHVVASAGDARIEQDLPLSELAFTTLDLPSPARPTDTLTLTISTPSDAGYLLLTALDLLEPGRPLFP